MPEFSFVSLCIAIALLGYLLNRWYRGEFIKDFRTKYVFITGTDSGFGQQLALSLDKIGVNVYAGCHTNEGAENLRCIASENLKTIQLDVTNQDSVDQARKFIESDLPGGEDLWGLVNNAGILGNPCFQLSNIDDYRKVMEVNFFGCIRVCEAFALLIQKSKGRIVNVISIYGRFCLACEPYASSKFALEPYIDGLRRAMKPFGVQVSTIEPGFFTDTNIFGDHLVAEMEKKWEILPELQKKLLGDTFFKDVANLFNVIYTDWPFKKLNKKQMVANVMIHALGAKRPKARYVCGYDARPCILIGQFAPDWFLDNVWEMWMKRMHHIMSKRSKG